MELLSRVRQSTVRFLTRTARANDAQAKSALSASRRNVASLSIDPYSYTSGRWLRQDKQQRAARHVDFNFEALCKRAAESCPGARAITAHEKKEGSFNRVFILHMDTGQKIVARIPFPIAGPQRLATHSEVASMAYLRTHTTIPVPKVLDWSDDASNTVGTEYIIMDHVPGVQLHGQWPSMDSRQHMLCVKALTEMVAEMARLEFPGYGSLYFANAPIDPSSKTFLSDEFCLGPNCGTPVWPCSHDELDLLHNKSLTHGPYEILHSFCSGLIEAGRARLSNAQDQNASPSYRGTFEEHSRLLDISAEVLNRLAKYPAVQDVAQPMLLHPDLNARNIYVSEDDPTEIVALIDWQSTCLDPCFIYANETPDLLAAPQDLLDILADDQEISAEKKARRQKAEKDVSICQQTFEVGLKGWAPKLYQARAMDETLFRVMRSCASSWRNGAAALREDLIDLSQHWHQLGLPGACPYKPTEDELKEHRAQYEDFETHQRLKQFLIEAVDSNSDGWIPSEAWDTAQEAQRAFFEQWMESVRELGDEGMGEEKARLLWPFDVD